ncbi:MAG: hypothetical protein Q9170_007260 [Blastenia crenularia]
MLANQRPAKNFADIPTSPTRLAFFLRCSQNFLNHSGDAPMAPREPGTEPASRNILSLDKSTEPLSVQIDKACKILGVQSPSPSHVYQPIPSEGARYGPREEWTLRWLLKKLEGAGSDTQSIHLEVKLWQLIRHLILRVPVANLARLLRFHAFINLLSNTLNEIEDFIQKTEDQAKLGLYSISNGTSREASLTADSSSATVDFSVELSKTSKKRKRYGTVVNQSNRASTPTVDVEPLYAGICCVVSQLQGLTKDDSHGYAVEHLKIAIKASPEQAAKILGCGFDYEVASLERLILRHVIHPARDSFERSKKPRTTQAGETVGINIEQLLAPLQPQVLRSEYPTPSPKGSRYLSARFYRTVLNHTPLATSRQRTVEKGWLEFLFDHIALQASSTAAEKTASPDSMTAIKAMLGMLVGKQVKFEVATLEKVLYQYSHLLEGESHLVDWNLIRLCLQINPDVFVILAEVNGTSGKRTRKPNTYLNALFEKLDDIALSAEVTSSMPCRNQPEDVLIALAAGFAQARDLTNFIKFWKSNLTKSRRVAHRPEKQINVTIGSITDNQSVWESEDLLQAVATHVEQRMTIGQIDATLFDSEAAFRPEDANPEPGKGIYIIANLIILDCVLCSCQNENTIINLTEMIKKLYATLIALCEAGTVPSLHSWRVWRCLASIKNRWMDQLDLSSNVEELEARVVAKALKLLSRIDQSISREDMLQSLSYLFSVVERTESPTCHKLAESVVGALIEVSNTDSEEKRHLVESFTFLLSLRPRVLRYVPSSFIMEFIADAARAVNPELQFRFFELLFNNEVQLHPSILEEDMSTTRNFRTFQLDRFLKSDAKGNGRPVYARAFASIQQPPSDAFDRNQRAKIFNRVVEMLLQGAPWTSQLFVDHMKLLIAYTARPNKSMHLLRIPAGLPQESVRLLTPGNAALFQIARRLSDRCTPPSLNEAVTLLKILAQKVLESSLSDGVDEETVAYLQSYYRHLSAVLTNLTCSDDVFLIALVGTLLDFYYIHFDVFPIELQVSLENLASDRVNFMELLCKSIDFHSTREVTDLGIFTVVAATSSFVSYLDVLSVPSSGDRIKSKLSGLEELVTVNNYHNEERDSASAAAMQQALETIRSTQRLLDPLDASELVEEYQKTGDLSSVEQQRQFISTLLRSATGLNADGKAEIIKKLLDQASSDQFDRNTLLLLEQLIRCQADADTHSSSFSSALSDVVNHLYQIMAVITTCASCRPSSRGYTTQQDGLHYLELCRLFSTILALHRKRLGGRSHLILLAVQSLLRPLFIPFTTAELDSLGSSPINSSSYNATHVSAYSHILLQLADPPLSSLTSYGSREEGLNLNDATKTAKSIAGQYLHYLIMTYCECQLKGRLEKEVREKLKPGLWAVLEVIPQEVMRVMNSAMGKEGRGVWKAIYAEWMRETGGRER